MRMWAKGAAGATLLTASFVAFGAGPALADVTSGNDSVLGGNQVSAPISIPVNISGNGVAVLGRALAGSKGGATVHNMSGGGDGGGSRTSGRHSILGGNQVHAPINAPINACGNSIAVVGGALSGCEGGAKVRTSGHGGGGHYTDGRGSIGGGNQVHAPINAPVNICGTGAAVIGDALAGCQGGTKIRTSGYEGGDSRTSGRHSVLGGNQVHAPVNAPINVCGNAIGNALAGCQGGAKIRTTGYEGNGGHYTDGRHSIGGGNQVHAPVNAPVDVCGNAAAVIGHALAACQGSVGAPVGYAGGYAGGFHGRTSGRGSIGGGNQVHAPVNAPVDVCGNAAAVIGRALSACGAEQGGYSGYGDDCPPEGYRMSGTAGNGLPQLPIDPASLRTGAMPVAMGATPALPKLGNGIAPQSAQNNGPLGGGLGLPVVGGPPKQLPPVNLTAAESSAGSPSGALLALALGGMFAASAGTVTVARRLGRRSSR